MLDPHTSTKYAAGPRSEPLMLAVSFDRRVHVGVPTVRVIVKKIYDPVSCRSEAHQLSPLQSCAAPCQN